MNKARRGVASILCHRILQLYPEAAYFVPCPSVPSAKSWSPRETKPDNALPALNGMSTRKSLFFSFLDRYASLAISVVASMVIARLLTPAEIGVFSVTMVLLMFVTTFRDLGAGQYLVQEKELNHDRVRAVWAVQLGLGLVLACLVLLASYPVAAFLQRAQHTYVHRENLSKPRKPGPKPHKYMTQKHC